MSTPETNRSMWCARIDASSSESTGSSGCTSRSDFNRPLPGFIFYGAFIRAYLAFTVALIVASAYLCYGRCHRCDHDPHLGPVLAPAWAKAIRHMTTCRIWADGGFRKCVIPCFAVPGVQMSARLLEQIQLLLLSADDARDRLLFKVGCPESVGKRCVKGVP